MTYYSGRLLPARWLDWLGRVADLPYWRLWWPLLTSLLAFSLATPAYHYLLHNTEHDKHYQALTYQLEEPTGILNYPPKSHNNKKSTDQAICQYYGCLGPPSQACCSSIWFAVFYCT